MRVHTGAHHDGRRRSGSHESTGGNDGRRRSGSRESSPTVHDARLHMTRRLREAWTDAFVLFPVRDLDLLARATPAVMRLQPSPKTFPQLLAALRSVATEHDDHELIDAMAPISYRLDKDLAEDLDPGPPVAGSPARWLPRQDSTVSAGAASPGGGRRTTQRRHARSPRPAPGAAPAPAPSSSSRRDRHRRRRQQTEAAHRRALARLDRLRLPDTTPNPYAAKAGKRRSTG